MFAVASMPMPSSAVIRYGTKLVVVHWGPYGKRLAVARPDKTWFCSDEAPHLTWADKPCFILLGDTPATEAAVIAWCMGGSRDALVEMQKRHELYVTYKLSRFS